jgi:hypothetical protein
MMIKLAHFDSFMLPSFRRAEAVRGRVCGFEAGASMHWGGHEGDLKVTG